MRNRFKNKWYGKQGKLGFTLIEVLVAIAILALLAIPLAQSMITSAQINSQSKNVGSASDMAQTVAESMQATNLGDVLTEINGYHTNSVGHDLFNTATGEGYSFLNNALQGYSVESSYEVMLLCPGCNARLSNASVEAGVCEKCSAAVNDNNITYVPVRKQNDVGVQSDADVTSSIKTRTTRDNVVRTYFTGNADDTYDFVLKNIYTEEASFDVLVHVEPEQTLEIADISSMSSSDLVNIVEKRNLDEDVAETFFQSHQMYCSLRHTSTTMTVQDFQNQMTRQITIDIRNDAIRGTTVITVKAVYTAPEGTVDVADKYISKTVGSFTTNSTAELADGVYLYYYPLRGHSRDVIIVNNPDSMAIKIYFILMEDNQTGEYNPVLKFSDLTPSNAANTTTFCSNHPEDKFAELPSGVHVKTLSNTTEQQTLYSMDVKVFRHKDSSFDENGVFTPDDKYLIVDTDATLLDSSEKFDINVDSEFGNPIPEEPEGGEPGDAPGGGDDIIGPAPNRGYSEAGGQNFVYSGNEYDVTIFTDGTPNGKFVEWSGTTKATNAGVYFAYAKPTPGHTWPNGTNGKRQVTWTIARLPAAIIEPQNAVYDAQEHLGYAPDTNKTNFVTMTGDVSKTDAGHYTIYVTPDPNYAWLDDGSYTTREITWTISPCPITLTWKTGEGFDIWQYDGVPHSGTCEVGGLQGSDTPETVKPNIRDNRIIEVGKITAKVTSLNNPNYALPTQGTTHELTVWGAKEATVVMKPANNGVVSMIYNGKEQTGVEFSVGVAITGTTHAIDAGKYTIIATPLPGYAWDEAGNDKAPREFEWEILQKEVILEWGQPRVWDYDGVVHSTTCRVTNLAPDTVCDVEISNNAILDAGTQEVRATLTNKNYKFPDNASGEQSPIQTLKVNPLKDATYAINAPVVYDGQTHTWGTGSHIQIQGTLSETEAGKYQVTIQPTKNHTWADGTTAPVTKTWEIKHSEMSTVSWDNYCYTGEEIIGVLKTFCDWGDDTWKATEKGTYSVRVTPSKNYAWADDPNEIVYEYEPQNRDTRVYTWKIVGNTVVKPDPDIPILNFGDPITSFEYNGKIWSPLISTIDGTLPLTDAVFQKNPYYSVSGTKSAINVGKYQAVISLKDKERSTWSDGTTDDVVINWEITKRKITLYTIPHEGADTWWEGNAFDSQNSSTEWLTAYHKKHNGMGFQAEGYLQLNLATSATVQNGIITQSSGDGDMWLTKDEFPKYDFDYKDSIQETTPLGYLHTISFTPLGSPNLINTEVDDYNRTWKPVDNNGNLVESTYASCADQANAGVYFYTVKPTIKDKDMRDVTSNYEITYNFSYLLIDKVPVDVSPIKIVQNAKQYTGKEQSLVKVLQAPTDGTLEYLWEGVMYKASNDYNTPATITRDGGSKYCVIEACDTGFTGTSVNNPAAIRNLIGEIDFTNPARPVLRDSYEGWSTTIPTGVYDTLGEQFTSLGTNAGGYVVYYRVRGDANHLDTWNDQMKVVFTVKQAEQHLQVQDIFDRCYNSHNDKKNTDAGKTTIEQSQFIKTWAQEKPAITYNYSGTVTTFVQTPKTSSHKNSSENLYTSHTNAVSSIVTTELKTQGKTGETTLEIRAAATENYAAGKANITIICQPHLSEGLRDTLFHWYKKKDPTCTQKGTDYYICLECGETDTRPIKELGHSCSSSTSGGWPCTVGTTTVISCRRCSYSETKHGAAAYGAHNYKWISDSQHKCINVMARWEYWEWDEASQTSVKKTKTVRCDYITSHPSSYASKSGCCYYEHLCSLCSYGKGCPSHFHRGGYTRTSKSYIGMDHWIVTTYTCCSCCRADVYSSSKYV